MVVSNTKDNTRVNRIHCGSYKEDSSQVDSPLPLFGWHTACDSNMCGRAGLMHKVQNVINQPKLCLLH